MGSKIHHYNPEVNSSPGLEGIETATGKDIANEMIIAIEKKLKFKRL